MTTTTARYDTYRSHDMAAYQAADGGTWAGVARGFFRSVAFEGAATAAECFAGLMREVDRAYDLVRFGGN